MNDRCSLTVTAFEFQTRRTIFRRSVLAVANPFSGRRADLQVVGVFGGYSAVFGGVLLGPMSNDKLYLRPNTLVAVNRSRLVYQPQIFGRLVIAMRYLP